MARFPKLYPRFEIFQWMFSSHFSFYPNNIKKKVLNTGAYFNFRCCLPPPIGLWFISFMGVLNMNVSKWGCREELLEAYVRHYSSSRAGTENSLVFEIWITRLREQIQGVYHQAFLLYLQQ